MHITLRANEKIFINGAVLKVDRKTSIELMNDAVFLLEAHVMLERDATTPLRQLYYIVQLMLMEPGERAENRAMLAQHVGAMGRVYENAEILDGLVRVTEHVGRARPFEALKVIRSLLPIEARLTGRAGDAAVRPTRPAQPKPSLQPEQAPMLAEAC